MMSPVLAPAICVDLPARSSGVMHLVSGDWVHCAVVGDLGAREPPEALDPLEHLLELLDLMPREPRARRDHERLDDLGRQSGGTRRIGNVGSMALSRRERPPPLCVDDERRSGRRARAEAKVGLVVAVARHRLVER